MIIGCGPTTCTRHQRTHSCAAYLPWASQPPQIYSLFYPWCSSSLLWCTLLRFYTSLWCTGYTVTGALYPCDYVHIPPQSSHFSLSPSVPLSMSRNVTHINYVYLHSGYAKITLSTLFFKNLVYMVTRRGCQNWNHLHISIRILT